MPSSKWKAYLDQEKIKYIFIYHLTAFTAQKITQLAHIPGNEMTKTVIVKIDRKQAVAVLPAPNHIDLDLLKGATDVSAVQLATESEFMPQFTECEIDAMSPFETCMI